MSWPSLDLEFAPQSIDIFLLVVHAGEFHQVVPHRGVSAIGPNHQVELDFHFSAFAAVLNFEPSLAFAEVGSCKLMAEEKVDIWHAVQNIQKAFVEPAAIHGKN